MIFPSYLNYPKPLPHKEGAELATKKTHNQCKEREKLEDKKREMM